MPEGLAADCVSAAVFYVEVIKDSGKRAINVVFRTRGGRLLPGGARWLNEITDWSLEVKYDDLGPQLDL